MKVTIEIDATPQEMRTLLGLPDIEPLQEEMLDKIRAKMLDSLNSNDPAEWMKLYMPLPDQLQTLKSLQESFWQSIGKGVDLSGREKKEKK